MISAKKWARQNIEDFDSVIWPHVRDWFEDIVDDKYNRVKSIYGCIGCGRTTILYLAFRYTVENLEKGTVGIITHNSDLDYELIEGIGNFGMTKTSFGYEFKEVKVKFIESEKDIEDEQFTTLFFFGNQLIDFNLLDKAFNNMLVSTEASSISKLYLGLGGLSSYEIPRKFMASMITAKRWELFPADFQSFIVNGKETRNNAFLVDVKLKQVVKTESINTVWCPRYFNKADLLDIARKDTNGFIQDFIGLPA